MICTGQSICSPSDCLQKVPIQYLYDSIRNPAPNTLALIRQLRVVQAISAPQYAELKRKLPYFVCAQFNPLIRKSENFAYTEYFVLDIDHISDKGLILADLKQLLVVDSRVMMCFISPSYNGLKVLFRLAERCYDIGKYKVFYQAFARKFSEQYSLQQVVDTKTCDITRACFMSYDPDVFLDNQAEAIRMADYINEDDNIFEALSLKRNLEKLDKEEKKVEPKIDKIVDPTLEAMKHIRQTLMPTHNAPKVPIYVPEELEQLMDALRMYVEEKGIEVSDIKNISYGKQIKFKLNERRAELNLFYGKRGFSVVIAARTGTDSELNNLVADVVKSFLHL